MSTISVINVKHPSSASSNLVTDSSGNTTAAGTVAMGSSYLRNRIINGAMVIDQRNAGAAVTVNGGSSFFTVDRWFGFGQSADGVFTIQQASATPPTGFTNYVRATVTTADASVGATQGYGFGQIIEGFNVADFGFGAAGASTISVSFWVRSSLTGTFTAAILNDGQDRSYAASFVINAANTWEYKTLTISGDTTGTWLKNNGAGLRLYVSLGTGSTWTGTANTWFAGVRYAATGQVNFISTVGATLDITGVQLEVGTVATPFERELYSVTFRKCQRYFRSYTSPGGFSLMSQGGYFNTSTAFRTTILFDEPMRATPTHSSAGGFIVASAPGNLGVSPLVATSLSPQGSWLTATVSGGTAGQSGFLSDNNVNSPFALNFSAEL